MNFSSQLSWLSVFCPPFSSGTSHTKANAWHNGSFVLPLPDTSPSALCPHPLTGTRVRAVNMGFYPWAFPYSPKRGIGPSYIQLFAEKYSFRVRFFKKREKNFARMVKQNIRTYTSQLLQDFNKSNIPAKFLCWVAGPFMRALLLANYWMRLKAIF